MIAVDTNVLARVMLGDDPRQSPAAHRAIVQAARDGGAFVSLLVLVELSWVLRAAPGWDAARVHQALDASLDMEGIEVESAPMARAALDRRTGSVGLADHLLVLAAKTRGCKDLLTFDRRLAKTGKARWLRS